MPTSTGAFMIVGGGLGLLSAMTGSSIALVLVAFVLGGMLTRIFHMEGTNGEPTGKSDRQHPPVD